MQAEVNLDNVTEQGWAILREVIHEYFERDGIPKELMPADLVDRNVIQKGRKGGIPKEGRRGIPKGGRGDIPRGRDISPKTGRGGIPKGGRGRGVFPKEFTPAELVDREPVLNIASRSVWHRDGERSEDVPRMSKSKSAPSRSHDEEHQKVEVVYTDEELVHMIALHLASIAEKISSDSVEGTPNPCPSLISQDAIDQMFKQVFKDGVYSWERVGLLFRCTAKACEKALNQTDEIIDKVMKLFRASVAPWIVESGGWVSPPLDSVSTDGGERHSEVSGIPATEGQRPQTVVHGRAGTSPPYLGSRSMVVHAGPETASEIQQSDLGLSHG